MRKLSTNRGTPGAQRTGMWVALLCGTCVANAAVLPEGVGKAEIVKVCSQCHSIDQTVSLRQGQAAWEETIVKMVNLGATVSDDDFNKILP